MACLRIVSGSLIGLERIRKAIEKFRFPEKSRHAHYKNLGHVIQTAHEIEDMIQSITHQIILFQTGYGQVIDVVSPVIAVKVMDLDTNYLMRNRIQAQYPPVIIRMVVRFWSIRVRIHVC